MCIHLGQRERLVALPATRRKTVVGAFIDKEVKRLKGVKEEITKVLFQVGFHDTTIHVVRYTSTVHGLTDKIP